jgi:hypothetical protein
MDQTPPAMTISEFSTKIQRRGNAKSWCAALQHEALRIAKDVLETVHALVSSVEKLILVLL